MSRAVREVFFLDGEGGGRFCIVTRPHRRAQGGVLYVHPFAEEMNKSRRMAARAALAFADRGWTVVQPDLFGCGDSAGDFGEATWPHWVDDVGRAWEWLQADCEGPLILWGLRAGALLASDWLAMSQRQVPFLMWQPVISGRQHLTQFLRLKAAGEMLAEADARGAMAQLRAELQAGRAIEVAGYLLDPSLSRGLEDAALRVPEEFRAPVAALEIAAGDPAALSPALSALVSRWSGSGVPITADAVNGPFFWQTQEIEVAPALVARSCIWLDQLAQ